MNRLFTTTIALLLFFGADAQYWFGPKVGTHVVSHRYQLEEYKADSFNISPDLRWQAGFVIMYTASDRYSVGTEINFERIGRTLQNNENEQPTVFSKLKSSFISIPLIFRINFGQPPVHFYLNGGPKISFWLGGSGVIRDLDEFLEFRSDDPSLDYKLFFNEERTFAPDQEPERLLLSQPNIIQYALTVGGGAYFDIRNGSRIMVDLRYSYGHSNMGFNENPDFTFVEYQENWKYTHDMFSFSVAYLFEFDQQLQMKGRSTNKMSN